MLTRNEIRELLKREPVRSLLNEYEMDDDEVRALADSIIETKREWAAEQWPPGEQGGS